MKNQGALFILLAPSRSGKRDTYPQNPAFVLDYLEQYDYVHEVLNPDAIKGDTEIVAFPTKPGV